jgi:hypothetical protein
MSDPPVGDSLRLYGKDIPPGADIFDIPVKDLSKKEAILVGKCYSVSMLDAQGVDEDTQSYLYYEGFGDPYDLVLEAIASPKWLPVSATWGRDKPAATSSDFFKDFTPLISVRQFVSECLHPRYNRRYWGSYVNSHGTFDGMIKLREKMRGCEVSGKIVTRHDIPRDDINAIYMIFLECCQLNKSAIPLVLNEFSVKWNSFRSSAALGASLFDIPNKGTKGNWLEAHKANMEWIIAKIQSGENPEDFLAPWYHVMAAKAETRGPDVPRDKVRLIFQQAMEPDAVGEYFARPLTEWFSAITWYLPGCSMLGNYYPKMLLALRHPDASRFFKVKYAARNEVYFCLDQTSQDWNYVLEILCFLMFARVLFFKPPESECDFDFWTKLIGFELAHIVCKLIQLWGGSWWYLLGAFCSGSKWTTWSDTCESFLIVLIIIWAICGNYLLDVLRELGIVCYGDDTTISMPVSIANRWDFNLKTIVKNALRAGCKIKLDGSSMLVPTPDHKDKFYTLIRNSSKRSKVVSEGVRMLQRYMVKVDKNLNCLHPDSEDFFTSLPWRPTEDYIPKIGLDAENWKDESQPYIQWYRKAFGLLIDSALNLEAHTMIKFAMSRVREDYPKQVVLACSGFNWNEFEFHHKLGELDSSLIEILPQHPKSFQLVCSLYFPTHTKVSQLLPSLRNCPLPTVYTNSGY